jgi:glucose-1-phosphate cytidylyltransferase
MKVSPKCFRRGRKFVKAVILAGGLGTRISEETSLRPKPMIDIGGRPLLWHVMQSFSMHGVTDFVILCGYKGYVIKEFFANYFMHMSNITFDLKTNEMEVHSGAVEPWRVTLLDTGESTQTGGRLRRAREYIGDETFFLTYGDGVADVNVTELLAFHQRAGKLATVTGVRPPGRFGMLKVEDDSVLSFLEKPEGDGNWIFFVLEPTVIDLVEGDMTLWEQEPLSKLAAQGQLSVFKHTGIWQPVDTLRDKTQLVSLWESGKLPWSNGTSELEVDKE